MTSGQPISRRALLRGRFAAALRTGAADPESGRGDRASESASASEPREAATPPDRTRLVMRYPTTAHDVGEPTEPVAARARRSIPVLRPPGAVDEATFLAECTRCDACVQACPHDAIVRAPERLREAAGTPIVDPDVQPCRLCADGPDPQPCIDACEPDVLSRLVPIGMGTARIVAQTCLAHQGTTCTVCSEQCPVPDAIVLDGGCPRVDESACVGCGVCRYVCPSPQNAVLLMPTFVRPAKPTASDEERSER